MSLDNHKLDDVHGQSKDSLCDIVNDALFEDDESNIIHTRPTTMIPSLNISKRTRKISLCIVLL